MAETKNVRFVVAKHRNFHDGLYWKEWRINREENSGGLISSKPVADIFGSRRHALWVAEAMTIHAKKRSKFARPKRRKVTHV